MHFIIFVFFPLIISTYGNKFECDVEKGMDLAHETIKFISSLKKSKIFIGISTISFFNQVIQSIYGPCNSYEEEIDKVLTSLDHINDRITGLPFAIKCFSLYEHTYESIAKKIHYFLTKLKEMSKTNNKNAVKNDIKSHCIDVSQGVSFIYAEFQYILKETQVKAYLKNCARYESEIVEEWSSRIHQFAHTFLLIIQGCEKAFDYKTEFNGARFLDKISQTTSYYKEVLNIKMFVEDTNENGLNEVVKRILNEQKSAQETANKLKGKYSFFDWDVFFYTNKINGFENHAAYYNPRKGLCGSMFYLRNLKHNRNGLVSWCQTIFNKTPNHSFFSSSINVPENLKQASSIADYVWDESLLNFVLALRLENSDYFEASSNNNARFVVHNRELKNIKSTCYLWICGHKNYNLRLIVGQNPIETSKLHIFSSPNLSFDKNSIVFQYDEKSSLFIFMLISN